jgi:hypothetical protein
MWLVLCSSSDRPGLWVYEGLRQLGLDPLELVLAESLAHGSTWEHRVNSTATHLKITLPDGRILCSSRIRGAINRLLVPAPGIAQLAAPCDTEYAQAELQAFYLSWLYGLPGTVINRPTALGLCGAWHHASEWIIRAARAGLPAPYYRQSAHDAEDRGYRSLAPDAAATHNLIAFRGKIFGAQLPEHTARACTKLAQDSGTELLGLELFAGEDGEWTFANATPMPDLAVGGTPLLEHLAQTLREGAPS